MNWVTNGSTSMLLTVDSQPAVIQHEELKDETDCSPS